MESLLGNVRSSSANFLFCLVHSGQLTNQLTSKVNMLVTSSLNRSGSIIIARHQSFVLLQRTHAGWIVPAIVNFLSTSQINIPLDTLSLVMYNGKSASDPKASLSFLVCSRTDTASSSFCLLTRCQDSLEIFLIVNCFFFRRASAFKWSKDWQTAYYTKM